MKETDMRYSFKQINLNTLLPIIFIIAGLLGGLASFSLTHDKIQTLKNPDFIPACNINPILSCGSVMSSEQASIFGVPNTLFGLIGFSILLTIGVVLLAGAQFKRWMWLAAQFAASAGLLSMLYLFFQGVYRINAVCPWCFLVWMVTIPVFWYTTLYNLKNGHIKIARRFLPATAFMQKNHGSILITAYLLIIMLILERFWYFWKTLL